MNALGSAFSELLGALDRLEIDFLVGGSVASGTHGTPRMTNDIDILADLTADRVDEFCEVLSPSFYVDRDTILQALETGRSFNLIHLRAAVKFDIFPAGSDPFARSELGRRQYTTTPITGLEEIEFPVASPEDTVLAKLVWYRKGGQSSDRQRDDILGILRVQSTRLDQPYLKQWAVRLGVPDLLDTFLDQARTP